MSKTTPWGIADSTKVLGPGIISYGTPSHGGIELSSERNLRIPPAVKAATFKQLGEKGWYEEDVDWAIVAYYFPEAFTASEQDMADAIFGVWCTRHAVTP